MVHRIFLYQGSNPCPLHSQVNSYPLYHQKSPGMVFRNQSNQDLGPSCVPCYLDVITLSADKVINICIYIFIYIHTYTMIWIFGYPPQIHPAYLTYMQSTSWEMLGWRKHKLESRLPGEISITSDRQMTLLMTLSTYGRKWRRTKEPFHESERGEWKCWLKAQHSEN